MEAKNKSVTKEQAQADIMMKAALTQLRTDDLCQQVVECMDGKKVFSNEELKTLAGILNKKTCLNNWELEQLGNSTQSQPVWILFANHYGVQPGIIFHQLQDGLKAACFNYDTKKHRSQ